ncbi:DNA-binding MurR/RpiR family transcriptional regulator [Enterococcus sp. PF1-24]|uniref:MurR/RpiR family transcriptional regulator n=1 Tax=unclassified Enterococcus TaxID=2608891 RepID=UPI002476EA1A|nr:MULTISPECIES: MurR/RpiR family transcriptional regulator [unclassified Enterococcus]MDH6363663.1 DNA-binding MurR/RpiR family transcriptional regulator [Enterococcus sp. PFB1-1]MDH6400898.1 DNA-binding MurR/RpiR family transcriptional regulator [Enterococcus sp. PF1-24]
MLIREKMKSHKFSAAEQTVVDYILTTPETLADLTVQEIAKKNFTHPSTLIRIAKKLEYSGWSELKTAYLEEWQYLNTHFSDIDANLPFSSSDGITTIAKKIAQLEQTTIEDTLSLIHHDDLQKAKQLILSAKQIRIFASNANTLISQDFALKMNRIGKNVAISTTFGESMYEAYNCSEETCCILISYTGENSMIRRSVDALKEKQAKIIAITSIGENYLSSHCDALLPITTREKLYSKIGNFTTNTSICYLLDVLYSVVFAENYQKNLNHLIQLGQIVDNRKSNVDIMREAKPIDALKITDSWIPN